MRPCIRVLSIVLFIFASSLANAEGASVYIISPADGEIVNSPVKIQFGLTGMGIAPAGVERKNTGHHHLMIDVDKLPPMDQPVPANDNHRHFGGGQTEAVIDLAPGKHRLQLLLADHTHKPHQPVVISVPIEIEVR